MTRVSGKFLKQIWRQEVVTGTIDGVNTAFTISETPLEDDSLCLTVNGIVQRLGVDYTLSGSNLTMLYAPATGSSLFIQYVQREGE